MITKQQALEFIYELSQKTEVMLDITCGEVQFDRVSSDEYLYITFSEQSTFESAITKCIKENMEAIECLGIERIPVDISMLEVGQTYKVEFLDFTGVPKSFTETLLSVTEEDKPVFYFSKGYCTKYIDIKEIYKVNNG